MNSTINAALGRYSRRVRVTGTILFLCGAILIGFVSNWLLALGVFLAVFGVGMTMQEQRNAYRLYLHIRPNWMAILQRDFPEITWETVMAELIEHPSLKIDRKKSLFFTQQFSFEIVFCNNPALELIWSDHARGFVSDLCLYGHALHSDLASDPLYRIVTFKEYPQDVQEKLNKDIFRGFFMSPGKMGFSKNAALPFSITPLAEIPFGCIVQTLLELQKHCPKELKMTTRWKSIGVRLKKQLDKYRVNMDETVDETCLQYLWLINPGDYINTEDIADGAHTFITEFFEISLSLKAFSRYDTGSLVSLQS